MRYSDFFIVLVLLQLTQSKDLNTNSFYQKLRTPMYQHPRHLRSAYYPNSDNSFLDGSNQLWYAKCTEKTCGNSVKWCCPYSRLCGSYEERCTSHYMNRRVTNPLYGLIVFACLGVICCLFYCSMLITNRLCGSNETEVNNQSTIEPFPTSTQHVPVSAHYSVAIPQSINSCNLRTPETQSLVRDIPLRDLTVSVEQQPSQYANLNTIRETVTSLEQQIPMLPPAYNDRIDRDSITITTEHQSLSSPPTYDEFMQRN